MDTEAIDSLYKFEQLISNKPNYPDVPSLDNFTLYGHLFEILEATNYDIHLTDGYEKWKSNIITECEKRGLIKIESNL